MEETPQEKTRVRIFTDRYIIVGDIALFSGTRMTDYMVNAHDFIAVTNAQVLSFDEKALFNADFLDIQKNKIVIVAPDAAVKPV